MGKKATLLIIVLFAFLIAFSGCAKKKETTITTQAGAFIGGTDGLVLSMLPGQPPSQVFEGTPFQIGVQIQNKGEGIMVARTIPFKIQIAPGLTEEVSIPVYGIVFLSGVSKEGFNLTSIRQGLKTTLTPAAKIGDSVRPGGMTQVSFSAKAPQIVGASADYPIQIGTVYWYDSKSLASVCIKENVYQQTTGGPEVCKISGTKAVTAQSAPVKVASVEQNPAGTNTVGFNIKIKNYGKGSPFKSSLIPETESNITYSEQNWVKVVAVKVGTADIISSCSGLTNGEAYLVNNEATIYCNYAGKGEFVDLLTVELEYGYVEHVSSKIKVTGAPE